MGNGARYRGDALWVRVRQFAIATLFAAAWGLALLAAAPNVRAQDIHDGLVVHLTFDGDVRDHSGRGNDGMIVRPEANPDPFVAGIITNNRATASAFRTLGDFQGANMPTNNYITLGVPVPGSDLDFGDDTDITFSFWGKYAQDGAYWDPAWISNKDWTSGSNIGYVLAYQGFGWIDPNTGGFHWNYKTDTSPRTDSMRCKDCHLDDGQWHHYVVTFTRGDPIDLGGHGNMYIDGILLEEIPLNVTGTLDAGLAVNIMQDGLGTYTDTNNGSIWKDALISDVGIWRRALSQDEITTMPPSPGSRPVGRTVRSHRGSSAHATDCGQSHSRPSVPGHSASRSRKLAAWPLPRSKRFSNRAAHWKRSR